MTGHLPTQQAHNVDLTLIQSDLLNNKSQFVGQL